MSKMADVCATYGNFCRRVDNSSAGHMQSHVNIRRVVANGSISIFFQSVDDRCIAFRL